MTPKVPMACSKCDSALTESVKKQGTRVDVQKHWSLYVRLVHVSGNHSDHQLCPACWKSIGPSDLPTIWRRQCLLYGQSPPRTKEQFRQHHRFAHDVPIGILGVYER